MSLAFLSKFSTNSSSAREIMTGTGWATLPTSSSVCIIFFILAWKEIEKNDRTKYFFLSIKLHVFSSLLTLLLHTRHKTYNSMYFTYLSMSAKCIWDHPFKKSGNFHDFWPLPPYRQQFFTTICRQICPIFDPSP